MKESIEIGELLSSPGEWHIIDVRSPGEFLAGHIPEAFNLPLFSDEERARVGTLYKQVNPEAAMKEGLSIAGLKMKDLVEQAATILSDKNKKSLIHCWRGGKRSEAIQWLFNFSGMPSWRLTGGYKSYRNVLQSYFTSIQPDLRILGGSTGSGKTEVLKEIAKKGHQVIDLEKLAHHKGSAFGSIGEESQPSNEQFENDLFSAFLSKDLSQPIWLENESKSIGRVHLPDGLWKKMKESMLYNIDVDKEIRLDRVLEYYANQVSIEQLQESFDKIHKRLGGLEYQNAIKALHQGDLRSAASIALKYYDKSYTFQLNAWAQNQVIHFPNCEEVTKTAERLLQTSLVS